MLGITDPFYTGGIQALVPALYDVAIGGRGYMVDFNHDITGFRDMYFRRESIAENRTQADNSSHPGEASLNPDSAWRRAQETWHHGAGQLFLDRDTSDSDIYQYRTSQGVNPWTPWQLTLLPDTVLQRSTAQGNLQVVQAAGYVYLIDGQNVVFATPSVTTDAESWSWTEVTGPSGTPQSICTDGSSIYVAYGSQGVWTAQAGFGSLSLYQAGAFNWVGFSLGRLMGADGPVLYNLTEQNSYQATSATMAASSATLTIANTDPPFNPNTMVGWNITVAGAGAGGTNLVTTIASITSATQATLTAPALTVVSDVNATYSTPTIELYAGPSANWVWTDCDECNGWMCLTGYAGDTGMIFGTQVAADGATLDVPSVIAQMAPGEQALCCTGNQGFLAVGSNLGLRVASIDTTSGAATLGARIPTFYPVQCTTAFDRFVYYGLSNFGPQVTGLGRGDMSTFIGAQSPAFASDLMAAGQGAVTGVAVFGETISNVSGVAVANAVLCFAVAGQGIYTQSTNLVASGSLFTGQIEFGMDDSKTALWVDVRHAPLEGSVEAFLSANQGVSYPVGLSNVAGTTEPPAPFALANLTGETFEMGVTLTPSTFDPTSGPTLNRLRLRAYPTPDRTWLHTVPLLLAETINLGDTQIHVDPLTEFNFLTSWGETGELLVYQMGELTVNVKMEDHIYVIEKRTQDNRFFSGTYVVQMQEFNP